MRKDIQGINAAWAQVIKESYGDDFPEDSDLRNVEKKLQKLNQDLSMIGAYGNVDAKKASNFIDQNDAEGLYDLISSSYTRSSGGDVGPELDSYVTDFINDVMASKGTEDAEDEAESQDLYMLKYSLLNGLEIPTFAKLAGRALVNAGYERADVESMDTLELIARIEELTDMELATDGRTVGID